MPREGYDMTDYLYAEPSFLGGMARVLDLGDTLTNYNYSPSPESADTIAIQEDWRSVGDDLRAALKKCKEEHVEQV